MADAMGPSGPRATRGGRAVATPSRRRHASFAVSMGVDAVRDGIRRDDAVARGLARGRCGQLAAELEVRAEHAEHRQA